MAESAVMHARKNPLDTLVVIAGVGHVTGRVGIPDRIHRRMGGGFDGRNAPFVIVPQQVHRPCRCHYHHCPFFHLLYLSFTRSIRLEPRGRPPHHPHSHPSPLSQPPLLFPLSGTFSPLTPLTTTPPSPFSQVDWNTESGLPEVTTPLSAADCDWAWYTEKEIESTGTA